MRLTINWLKDFVDIDMEPEELAHLLTMTGLEVEEIQPCGHGLEGVVAARVISFEKHPNADRLSLCRVDTGGGEVDVVCGAPNLVKDMLTAYAPPGIQLPNGIAVRETKIRGQASRGILLAEDEMGLTDDHTGIIGLPSGCEPGTPVTRVMPLEDWALEIGLTPNRPDCASVMGVAREIAARTGKTLRRPEAELQEEPGPGIEEFTSVDTADPRGCPRYSAGLVRGVNLGPSPFWMRYRLHASGIRSISNVVDVTNYVMLETGQPLHAFDFHRLGENRIMVRRAREGEMFTTLDNQSRRLAASDLMICDGKGSVALAGVMGGLNSEIYEETRDVLVESACFDPLTIRKTSRRLGLQTEAAYRFERGVDIEGTVWALGRSMSLLSLLAGGKIVPGIIDNYPRPYSPRTIPLRVGKTNDFLGTNLKEETMAGFLRSLSLEIVGEEQDLIEVVPPSFRVDLEREVDLMEEVARMEGYDRIQVTLPAIRPEGEPDPPEVRLAARVRDAMAGFGFSEVINFSFVPAEFPDVLGAPADSPLRQAVGLLKPLTIEQAVMRTTLLHGLLQSAAVNIAHGERNLRLFEWGKVFFRDESRELPRERLCLAALATGAWSSKGIYGEERAADFFDAKGVLEGLLESLGLREYSFARGVTPPGYDPVLTAEVLLSGKIAGFVGEIASPVAEAFDLGPDKVFAVELDMPVLMDAASAVRAYEPITRYPAVWRDLTILVHKGVESSRIHGLISDEDLVESVELIDLYQGERVGPSEKALTYRICYRSRERTLDRQEVGTVHEKILKKIGEETGGKLRDG